MCYRTKLNTKISAIERTFEAQFSEPEKYEPREEINGFDFLKTPVIADHAPGEILFYNWGLIPFWARNDQIKKATLNAKIESLSEKPAFRDAIQNRCLVIADGFYEWQWNDEKGKTKQKFLITAVKEEVFCFAGIYSQWQNPNDGQQVYTYSVLTTEANDLMAKIHNNKKRMPVVLHQRDHHSWLQGKNVEHFAFPYEIALTAKAV